MKFSFWFLHLPSRLIGIPSSYSLILVQIKSLRYFGVQTFVELLCHHKRQIPGVGRNVYVWQLNAVLPTTGLILHPWGDGRFGGAEKGKRSKWQEPGSMFMTPSRRTFSWCPMMMLSPPTSRYSPKHLLVLSCATEPDNCTPVSNWVWREQAWKMQIWGQTICAQKIWVNTFRSKNLGQTTWVTNLNSLKF